MNTSRTSWRCTSRLTSTQWQSMRFLNTRTARFEEKDPTKTTYAILSHTWDNRGGHSKRFWAILTTIQSLLQLQKRFRIYSGSGRLERFWSESSLLQKRLRRSIWLQNRASASASAWTSHPEPSTCRIASRIPSEHNGVVRLSPNFTPPILHRINSESRQNRRQNRLL